MANALLDDFKGFVGKENEILICTMYKKYRCI